MNMSLGTLSIANNGNTVYGKGAINHLSKSLLALGASRPLIITDRGILNAGLLEKLLNSISDFPDHSVFMDTPSNPDEAAVEAAALKFLSKDCDAIIGFGGGSSLDLAKATGLRATHEGSLERYTTQNSGVKLIGNTPPMIAIPTTAGTGSEVARAAVIILENGEKRIIASPKLMPDVAILDPLLTIGLPPLLTAATGMDAVTHCIEAVLSPVINPTAEAIGLCGLSVALRNGALLSAVEDGSNEVARINMMAVSTHGAMAFSKGLGAVHAMSHACGKNEKLRLHHGTLNAVLLPTVLRVNSTAVGEKCHSIADAIGIPSKADLASYFLSLNSKLGLPSNLAEMGIVPDMVPDLAVHASIDFCSATNPVSLDVADYESLFHQALACR
jgi:4-hydroxybutyrate dehydrogenase